MEEISLSTIRSVVGALASGICIADIRESVEQALRSLLDPCIAQLEQPELKNAKSAAHILCAAASAAGIIRSNADVTSSLMCHFSSQRSKLLMHRTQHRSYAYTSFSTHRFPSAIKSYPRRIQQHASKS